MVSRSLVSLIGCLALLGCGGDAPEEPAAVGGEPPARADVPWIVAAAHPLAVEAGADVLREGGNAVDAAIAVQAVLGLVEPQSSGLGGGAFMLYWDAANANLIAYDGREIAPATTYPAIFLREDGEPMGFYEAVTSGFSVGVPGVVAMLDMAHREHGELPWARAFEPAEELAREGFAMPQRLHDLMERFAEIRREDDAAIYLDANGSVKPIGAEVRNPAYADTVAQLASGGGGAFYNGPIAEAIIERVNAKTGEETLSLEDFAAYEPVKRDAVCARVMTRELCSMPPPSSGGVTLLQIAQLFERAAPNEAPEDAWLAYIEASRLAYADRNRFLGDPTAMGTEGLGSDDLVERLVDPAYLEKRLKLVGDAPLEVVEPGDPDGGLLRDDLADDQAYEVPSTSHFSIRDSRGNIVSMTSSVEMPFGSQLMAGGMVLNNQLTDFSRVPEEDGEPAVNAPGPGKRPMSSMTPVIVFGQEGEPLGAIGSPGGAAIIGYVAKPLLDHFATGQPLSEAVLEPHVVVPRGSVLVEEGGEVAAAEIRGLGYEVTVRELTSGLYGFMLDGDEVDLIVDPRREGSARIDGR